MPATLIASVMNTPAPNGNTSAFIDTTGANLIVCHVSSYAAGPTPTLSDNGSQTWTPLTARTPGGGAEPRSQLFYSYPAVNVGAGHSFTVSGTGIYHTTCWAAFSGVTGFDQESGASIATPDIVLTVPSVTPVQANELFIAAIAQGGGTAATPGGSYAYTHRAAYSGGTNEGGVLAYFQQGTAAALGVSWAWVSNASASGSLALFKTSAITTTNKFRIPTTVADGTARKLTVYTSSAADTAIVMSVDVTASGGFFKYAFSGLTVGTWYRCSLYAFGANDTVDCHGASCWAEGITE